MSDAYESFGDWLARMTHADRGDEPMTFAQYGRYLDGWHNSKPWAYRGMTLHYFEWAMSHWHECEDAEALRETWKWAGVFQACSELQKRYGADGLAAFGKQQPTGKSFPSHAAAADFLFETRFSTLPALILASVANLYEQQPGLFPNEQDALPPHMAEGFDASGAGGFRPDSAGA